MFTVFVTDAGRRHDDDAATAVHPGGDGPRADGEEPVQRETDGAAGGRTVDRNDQVEETKTLLLCGNSVLHATTLYLAYAFVLLFNLSFLSGHPGRVLQSKRKRSPPSGSCEIQF